MTEATRRAQDEIKASAVLAREYQHKIAEAERGASEMMAKKIEACDRLLSEQAQEHAAALMRATSHHQEMLRRAEEQLMQRNQELETALNKQASEWNESSARRIAVGRMSVILYGGSMRQTSIVCVLTLRLASKSAPCWRQTRHLLKQRQKLSSARLQT